MTLTFNFYGNKSKGQFDERVEFDNIREAREHADWLAKQWKCLVHMFEVGGRYSEYFADGRDYA